MRCYYVLVHGTLNWQVAASAEGGVPQPRGFYCHRYLLAPDEGSAAEIAFRRVRSNLDRQSGWLADGSATLHLEAEEISVTSFLKLLKPDNRGHSFYQDGEPDSDL
jgi:hypothetical protein